VQSIHQERENRIRSYMLGWLNADESLLLSSLAPHIRITESHGPVYEGIGEVQQWFRDWCRQGNVLRWDALHFLHQGEETVVKWFFRCRYEGRTTDMDGVSLVTFDAQGRILSMEEYQSKAEHHRPYGAP